MLPIPQIFVLNPGGLVRLVLHAKETAAKLSQFCSLSYAFIQSFLAISQWSLASFIAFTFMREMELNISYPQALFTFLAASLGGVVARIPSGMGVLEAIFLKLNEDLPSAPLLAAIISFRAVYYIVPLMAAIPSYIAMEIIQRRGPNK